MMQLRTLAWFWMGLAAYFAGLAGYGRQPTLNTEYVEGAVTLDGQPVPEATVTFVPATERQGVSATGMTNQRGVYKLTATVTGELAAVPEAGTLPGEYYVGVAKTIVETPMTEEERAEQAGVPYVPTDEYASAPKTTFVVPQKYNNPRESGIRVTVESGRNTIPLELTSD